MSDTTTKICKICHIETDCIDGICQECNIKHKNIESKRNPFTVRQLISELEYFCIKYNVNQYEVRIRSLGEAGDHFKATGIIVSASNPILVIQ